MSPVEPIRGQTGRMPDLGHLGAVPYHLGYATRDLDEAMAAFSALHGLAWAATDEGIRPGLGPANTDGWRLRQVVSLHGPVHTELAEGSPGSIWGTTALAEPHHLAYWCEDLVGAVAGLQADGWDLELTLPDAAGRPTEFAYLTKPAWPRLELVDLRRSAAFVEVNQHRGPLGLAGEGPVGASQ